MTNWKESITVHHLTTSQIPSRILVVFCHQKLNRKRSSMYLQWHNVFFISIFLRFCCFKKQFLGTDMFSIFSYLSIPKIDSSYRNAFRYIDSESYMKYLNCYVYFPWDIILSFEIHVSEQKCALTVVVATSSNPWIPKTGFIRPPIQTFFRNTWRRGFNPKALWLRCSCTLNLRLQYSENAELNLTAGVFESKAIFPKKTTAFLLI